MVSQLTPQTAFPFYSLKFSTDSLELEEQGEPGGQDNISILQLK
jgi:hypothetical protein